MSEQGESIEAGPGGIKIATRKGDLINLLNVAGIAVLLYGGWMHTVDAKESAREDRQVFVQAIKENTLAMRQQVAAQRVANCLAALSQEQRKQPQMLDFCKSLENGR